MHQRRRPGSAVHVGRSQRSSPRRPLIAVAVEIAVATPWHARVSDAGSCVSFDDVDAERFEVLDRRRRRRRRTSAFTGLPDPTRRWTICPPSMPVAPTTRFTGPPLVSGGGASGVSDGGSLSAPGPTALEALDDDIEPHHPVRRRDARAAAVITALFADTVGSTALGERLDPEDFHDIVGGCVARMIVAVERFGGAVKDLVGDGILAVFGAVGGYEDDARAVFAGLDIVREIAYATEVVNDFGAKGSGCASASSRAGPSSARSGAAAKVEYGAMGDPLNTAARLQGAAAPGLWWWEHPRSGSLRRCSTGRSRGRCR